MDVGVIINPVSGPQGQRSGEGAARAALAKASLEARRIDGEVALTDSAGHAATLATRFLANGARRIVAWGGDGTVNEVAGPLVGTPATLGIVASGSGDGLARGLGLPLSPASALGVALSGLPRLVDVGFLGTRHFLNVAGVGFDAAVAAAFNAGPSRGVLSYVRHALSALWGYRAPHYDIDLDGARQSGPRFLVAFANGRQYGNRLVLHAGADPADGWLNVVIVEAGAPWLQMWRSRRLAFRPAEPADGVSRTRVQRARITGSDLVCHVDGEPFTASGTLEVHVRPQAIAIASGDGSLETVRTSAGTSRNSSKES